MKTLKIGITGGIGTGKSYVANVFNQLGAPLYNADERAKWLMHNQPKLRQAITKLFGHKAYQNNQLNREHLSKIIFTQSHYLAKLNALVHPAVANDFDAWYKQQNTPYIIKEAALLFESKSFLTLDAVLVVDAPLEVRIARCLQRDNTTREQVVGRIKSQLPQETKLQLADYVILNDGFTPITPQVFNLHQLLR